jgi:hypothetical protein
MNANIKGCPYCGPDNSTWVDGTLHLEPAGVAHIAEKWGLAFARMLEASCSQ